MPDIYELNTEAKIVVEASCSSHQAHYPVSDNLAAIEMTAEGSSKSEDESMQIKNSSSVQSITSNSKKKETCILGSTATNSTHSGVSEQLSSIRSDIEEYICKDPHCTHSQEGSHEARSLIKYTNRTVHDNFSFTDSMMFSHNKESRVSVSSSMEPSPESKNISTHEVYYSIPQQIVQPETKPSQEFTRKKRKCKVPPITIILILFLGAALIVSSYFALFGSPLSSKNFFGSLSDQQKRQWAAKLNFLNTNSSMLREQNSKMSSSSSPKQFSGIIYAPENVIEQGCRFSKEQAIQDVALLSTVTSRIRLYGTHCNQVDYVLHSIKALNIDMTVSMGIWIGNDTRKNEEQVNTAKTLLLTSDAKYINSVYVGNEVLSREDISEQSLISIINDLKDFVTKRNINVSVGTAEVAELVSNSLVEVCDVVGLNLQPFAAGIASTNAPNWAVNRLEFYSQKYNNGKTNFTISEIGWPYFEGSVKNADATPMDYLAFITRWTQDEGKHLKNEWYYFEAFDEPWKSHLNIWGAQWGIFDANRKLKMGSEFV